MSLFPRSMFSNDFPRFPSGGEFTPLFRLLDDYASHQLTRGGSESASGSLASFTPKFDVKETKDGYELHGELPGIEQKDVEIEFSDASTLVIKGRTERSTESGTHPSKWLESSQEQGKLTDTASTSSEQQQSYQKPTVEDESAAPTMSGGKGETSTEIVAAAAAAASPQQQQQQQKTESESHYWVSERSVGEFHRAFSFPNRVDHERVRASLKNGILSVLVPKHQAPTTRRINIE